MVTNDTLSDSFLSGELNERLMGLIFSLVYILYKSKPGSSEPPFKCLVMTLIISVQWWSYYRRKCWLSSFHLSSHKGCWPWVLRCAVQWFAVLRCALPLSDLDVKAAAEMSSFPYVLIQLSAGSIFTAQRIKWVSGFGRESGLISLRFCFLNRGVDLNCIIMKKRMADQGWNFYEHILLSQSAGEAAIEKIRIHVET